MKKLIIALMFAGAAWANQGVGGFCEQGNIAALTSGLPSTNVFQGSFPSCTVSVFTAGTTNLITIFADNINTPLSNPFTANTSGRWLFYSANNQRVDIQLSGGGLPSPWKINDVILNDPNGGVIVPSNFAGIRVVDGVTFTSNAAGINAADANLGATMGEVWIPSGAVTATDAQISIRAGHTLRIFGSVTIDALNKGPVLLGGTSKIACSGNYGAANLLNVSAQAIPSMVRLTTQDGSLGSMAIEGCRIDANGSTVTNGVIDASGATGGPSYVRENFITGLASGWGVFIQDIQSGALAGTNNVQIINNRISASGTGACIEILHSATNSVTINSIDVLDNNCAPGATSTTSVLFQNTDATPSTLRQINIANLNVTSTPTGQSSVSLNGVQHTTVKGLSCISGTNCLLIPNNANNAVIAVDNVLTYSGNNALNDAANAITVATSAIHYDFQGATTTQAFYRVNSTLSGNNTHSGNNSFTGTNTLSGPLVVTGTDTGTQTISGNKTFSGTNALSGPLTITGTDSGTQTITGNKTFSGTNALSGPLTITGTDSGTQTISGNKTFSGTEAFSSTTTVGTLNGSCAIDGVQYTTIAAAVAVAACHYITIPPGAYSISSNLTVSNNNQYLVIQPGATLTISAGVQLNFSGTDSGILGYGDTSLIDASAGTSATAVILARGGARNTFSNFKIIGNRVAGGTATLLACNNASGQLDRCVVTRLSMLNAGGSAINFVATTNGEISFNTITTPQLSCVFLDFNAATDGNKIINNTCNDADQANSVGNGAFMARDGGTLGNMKNLLVSGNTVLCSTNVTGNRVGIGMNGVLNLIVSNNNVNQCPNGGEGIAITGKNVTVNGNIVQDTSLLAGASAILFYGLAAYNPDSIVISNNVVKDGTPGISVNWGGNNVTMSNINVFGNRSYGAQNWGFQTTSGFTGMIANNIMVHDNDFTGNIQGGLTLLTAGVTFTSPYRIWNNLGDTTNTLNGTSILGAPNFSQCVTSQKTETAADTNLLTCAIPAVAGSYRVRFTLTTSAQNAATLGWTATWTDSNGAANTPANLTLFQEGTAAPALTFTGSSGAGYYGYTDIDVNNGGVSIVVKLTFSGTSFTGKASATVERII